MNFPHKSTLVSDFCLQCGKFQSSEEFNNFPLRQFFRKLKYKSKSGRFICIRSVEKMIGFHFKGIIISPNRAGPKKESFIRMKLIAGTSCTF